MKETFIVRADRKEHTVEIREVGSLYEIRIDGVVHMVDSSRIAQDTIRSILVGGRSYEINTVFDGDRCDVYLNGEIYPVEVMDELWARASQGKKESRVEGEVITAPIPGTVVALKVAAGQAIEPGTPIIIVEAMKMQNELSARSAGVVADIKVKPGDTVTQGQTLVVIKPADVTAPESAPAPA